MEDLSAEGDEDDHMKELNKELKKKNPNWASIQELQKLTFQGCQDFIKTLNGKNVVDSTFERYPFLKNEQVVIYLYCFCNFYLISYNLSAIF